MRLFVQRSLVAFVAVALCLAIDSQLRAEVLTISGANVYASGYFENMADYAPANAFDSSSSTRWASNYPYSSSDLWDNTSNVWIMADLGKNYTLNSLKIDWEASFGVDYTVRTRTDAQGFSTTLADYTTVVATINGRTGANGAGGSYDDTLDFTTGGPATFASGSASSSSVDAGVTARYLMIATTYTANAAGLLSIYGTEINGTATPEPSTMILSATAIIGLLAYAWRKRR